MSQMSSNQLAFITGIGGQDGSYLAEQLLADGVEVHGLSREQGRPLHVPAEVVLHHGDLTDHDATRALLEQVRPTQVFNLAAMSSVARL